MILFFKFISVNLTIKIVQLLCHSLILHNVRVKFTFEKRQKETPSFIKNCSLSLQNLYFLQLSQEGRDKLCKLLQYLFRFVAACYHIESYKNTKYTYLYESTKDARKVFRLFKSINQYQGMAFILFNEDENLTNVLLLFSRVCYFFYWAFDNVSILSKIKLFRLDYERFYRIGYSFWFAALVFMNTGLLISLFFQDEKNKILPQSNRFKSGIPEKCTLLHDFQIQQQEELIELSEEQKKKQRKQKWLKLIKNSFDLIPSGKDSKILQIIFNRVIPEKAAGFCGFISSVISIYQIATEINDKN